MTAAAGRPEGRLNEVDELSCDLARADEECIAQLTVVQTSDGQDRWLSGPGWTRWAGRTERGER